MELKTCSACKTPKPHTEFNACKSNRDGLAYQCKDCRAAYRARSASSIADYRRKWKRANRDKHLAHKDKRRAQKYSTQFEPINRTAVYRRDSGICGLCGMPVSMGDFHLDHVIPLSRGGVHRVFNVQVAHPLCNMKKNNRVSVP